MSMPATEVIREYKDELKLQLKGIYDAIIIAVAQLQYQEMKEDDSLKLANKTYMMSCKTYNWEEVNQHMFKPAFVFDGRNILDEGKLKEIGFEFKGIGKG